ncbi:MAG: hypothetical protein EPO08_20980 [Rhodospirillaceae bacterium]|nr:MAG: hypothetical protein EPO08_20980 [Rhodospirillaceae bacterium]
MAPKYYISQDLVGPDGLQSTSPHWVLGFARYANPITYDPTQRQSITRDLSFAYQERPPLVVDDTGGCINVTVSAAKESHTPTLQVTLLDDGTRYLNEILPGDWVVAYMVYSLDEMRRVSDALRAGKQMNDWESGLKFVGRSQGPRKRVLVNDAGVPQSVYTLSNIAFTEFDSTILYYPQLQFTESIPASMDKFGAQVSDMVRGNESNERGALDINLIVPKLISVIFGEGAWRGANFRGDPATPNVQYIVPKTILSWLGIDNARGTFADIMRVLMGVQKFSSPATNLTAPPGSLFWPDGVTLGERAFQCPFSLMGAFPAEVVPQTTTSPWAFLTNYSNFPLNETLVGLRPDVNGNIFPFFTVRQTPYTSELGSAFDLATFQADIKAFAPDNPVPAPKQSQPGVRAPTFTRVPTTRFLELPRWVIGPELVKESDLGRSEMMRQNLVFVFGSGPGVGPNEYDQFVNVGPVKDDLDIYRNGIRPYMPSVNCFLRDVLLLSTDWRDVMSDIVMGQHLTLNGALTISGIRAPIAPGDNIEFEGVVYHIESVQHVCNLTSDGKRSFITHLSLSRGVVDLNTVNNKGTAEERALQFPNTKSSDPEDPAIAITKD